MPFDRPTIQDVLDRMRGDVKGVIPDFDPFLPRSALLAIITAEAAAVHELNGRLERAARNHFVNTAELEELERLAAEEGLTRSLGTKAQGFVRFALAGEVVPAPTAGLFLVDGAGQRYVTISVVWNAGLGSYVFFVQATETGAAYNLAASVALDLEEAFAGIADGLGQVWDAAPIVGGTDDESIEDFRARVLLHKRRQPQGGTLTDFERWVFESISGGWTRVFVQAPATGSNLINIYAVNDAADLAGNAINRAAGDYTTAFNYINAAHRRPLCADVQVQAPTLVALNPAITLTPNTTAVQDAIKEEIVQLLIREATMGGTLTKTHLEEVVSRAAGETDHTITAPVGDTTVLATELLTIGTPVFS